MTKSTQALILLLILNIATTASAQPPARCAHPLYEVGFEGEALYGSKAAVIELALRGEPLRVGWNLDFDNDGESDLAHWSDARFVSVFDGELATQVETIHRQSPSRQTGAINLPITFDQWHGIIDTRGVLQGRFENSEKVGERKVKSVWCSSTKPSPQWRLIYKHDTSGKKLKGSKAALLNAVRGGQPLQIGWGLSVEQDAKFKSVEHIVSPVFVTITDQTDVIAQMPEHIAQQSYWNVDQSLFDHGAVMWRGLATTQGRFDAIWVNRASGEIVRRSPQRAAFSWFTYGPEREAGSLSIAKGVIADESPRN